MKNKPRAFLRVLRGIWSAALLLAGCLTSVGCGSLGRLYLKVVLFCEGFAQKRIELHWGEVASQSREDQDKKIVASEVEEEVP
jgi:hypothetical protein